MSKPSPAPWMWIDATQPAAGWRLWGMNLVERLLREGARRGLTKAIIVVSAQSVAGVKQLRRDLHHLFDVDLHFIDESSSTHLPEQFTDGNCESLLILEGDVVHDDRVLEHLIDAGPGHAVEGAEAVAAHLSTEQLPLLMADPDKRQATDLPGVEITELAQLGHYVADLRLTMVPFLIRVMEESQLRQVDRLLFHRTFKGVIDAIARYGYYHFVRWTTRWLSCTTMSPNLLTVFSILGIWAAIPCFATGQIGWGVLSAWLGVILDSVDGKLARLTVNLSDTMGAIEHASAMPGLGLWFVGLGWHLSGGELLSGSAISISFCILLGTFLADKVLTEAFKKRFGSELFDFRPVDAAFHLFAARRNVHLLLLTLGAAVGAVADAYQWMAAGMVASFLFHAVRFVWIALSVPGRAAKGD